MRMVKKMAAQGDVCFCKIELLPENVKQDRTKKMVVAHSEAGHDHVVDGVNVKLFRLENDPMICYLQVSGPYADIVHHRSFDTHETLRLPTGIWEARRQEEWSPEGWRMAAD